MNAILQKTPDPDGATERSIAAVDMADAAGRAMGVATVANWGFNLLVALTFLQLLQAFGPGTTFLIYAGLSVAGWLFAFYLVPETRGHSLEQIERFWIERRPIREWASDR